MRQKMDAMVDHTIVCGFGEMGRSVVRELDPSRVIVVTRDEDDLEAAREAGLLAVDGSPTEDESLRTAGVERARYLVATEEDRVEPLANLTQGEAFGMCSLIMQEPRMASCIRLP